MARVAAILLMCGLLAGACGGDDATSDDTETAGTPAASACEAAEAPEPKGEGDLAAPKARLDRSKTYVATVSTNCGDFEITLDAEQAPHTGGSFKALADDGFYDGLTFHRVVAGFVIQGGDPKGDGTGGPGYSVVEPPPDGISYTKGVVAMAKTPTEADGTSGSQFFVVTAEDAQLGPQFALLGEVTGGQEVVDKIGVVETDPATDAPVEPVVISSIEVTAR